METVFHSYMFDTNTVEGKAAWEAFEQERKSSGAKIMGPVFHAYSSIETALDGVTITLEADHLFDNQWNATYPGCEKSVRVFDWLLIAEDRKMQGASAIGIKRGHYLEQTDEMRAIRQDTLKCGYCGFETPKDGAPTFCPKCIGSEYLKPDDFTLTRLRPIDQSDGKFKDLTETEMAERMAVYRDAQREGAKTRMGVKLAKFRDKVEAKANKEIANAQRERDGMIWLLEHDLGGLAADNTIFYSHTGRFSFGWRNKVEGSLAHGIMGKLSDEGFPFPYDFETSNLGKLSGAVED